MIKSKLTRANNLVIELNSNWQGERRGVKYLWKKDTLKSENMRIDIDWLNKEGYTQGGYSAVEYLLELTKPDKILSKGHKIY